MKRNFFPRAAACLGLAALLLWIPLTLQAAALRARVYVVQSPIPANLNERGLLRFAASHNARKLREATEKPIEKREWLAQLIVSFSEPPQDNEFRILFYDVQEGSRMIDTMTVLMDGHRQKTFVQRIRLARPQFKPNRKMEMAIVVRGAEVSRQRFEIVGELPQRSGEVTFGDDER